MVFVGFDVALLEGGGGGGSGGAYCGGEVEVGPAVALFSVVVGHWRSFW